VCLFRYDEGNSSSSHDGKSDYDPDDFVEYFWLSPQEVLDRAQGDEQMKDDLPKLIRIFYVEE
jgi:hypothetical protein